MSALQREGGSLPLDSLCTCRPACPEDQRQREKSVIAQPIFVFEKREQTFKRPAGATLDPAAEHGNHVLQSSTAQTERNGFSRKRLRSSSFSLHSTDYQPQVKRERPYALPAVLLVPTVTSTVKKNNVFMTPTLVQRNIDMSNAEQGPVKHSEHILRPAILQPPQAQKCENVGHSAWEHCKTKEQTQNKVSENSCLLSKVLPRPRISVQFSTNQNFLGAPSVGCQPSEDKSSFKSYSSDFVFGENMVERVLGTQKLIQPLLENDSYAKEKPFKSTLNLPINSANSRTESMKNISLIESAAALSSKSSSKCLLKKADVITGEEAEYNVLKIHCKLFVFNHATQAWTERGRGALRLSDAAGGGCGAFASRLVMHNQGSLRLVLNSKLWAQMEIQRANHQNLRITATDLEDCSIKVFLIQASAKDTGCLYTAVHHRLVALRDCGKQKDGNLAPSPTEAALQQLNCDSCDEDEDDVIRVDKTRSDPSRWTREQSVACLSGFPTINMTTSTQRLVMY